jgi:hypothetical protein
MRFVVGHSASPGLEAAMDGEAALHGDIMRLPGLMDGYDQLPDKTRSAQWTASAPPGTLSDYRHG